MKKNRLLRSVTCVLFGAQVIAFFILIAGPSTATVLTGPVADALNNSKLEGTLEVIAECEETDGRTLFFLDTGKERYELQFMSKPAEELLTGMQVSVYGGTPMPQAEAAERQEPLIVLAPEQMVVEPTENATESAVTGEIKVLVFLVNFQNDTRTPYTRDQANNLMFNTTNTSSVTNYYREASYGQAWVTGTTVGYYTLPMDASCATGTIATLARAAASNAGVNVSEYSKHMFVFPSLSCGWSGYAMVGGRDSWINEGLDLRTVGHELGHNVGLQHARMLACAGTSVGGTCSSSEYGHMLDIMGRGNGHFHPFQKERLGWMNSPSIASIATVTGDGTYTVTPTASNGGGTKGLRVLRSIDSSGRRTWYYLEFRRPVGFDAFMTQYFNSNLSQGVMFTLNSEADSRENYQLDMNPATKTFNDSALVVGQTYTDQAAGVSMTTMSADSGGATVSVSFTGSPSPSPTPAPSPSPTPVCSLANPNLTASPGSVQWIQRGGAITYSLSVKNNNSSDCNANNFGLSTLAPSGWNVSSSQPLLNIPPGATVSTSVTVSPSQTASVGPAAVTFTFRNADAADYGSSVVRDLQVFQTVVLSVSTNSPSYNSGQLVVFTGSVRRDGAPVAGATVSFAIGRVGGRATMLSATTDSNGNASASYRLNKKQDPPGTYEVTGSSTVNNVNAADSATYFVR